MLTAADAQVVVAFVACAMASVCVLAFARGNGASTELGMGSDEVRAAAKQYMLRGVGRLGTRCCKCGTDPHAQIRS